MKFGTFTYSREFSVDSMKNICASLGEKGQSYRFHLRRYSADFHQKSQSCQFLVFAWKWSEAFSFILLWLHSNISYPVHLQSCFNLERKRYKVVSASFFKCKEKKMIKKILKTLKLFFPKFKFSKVQTFNCYISAVFRLTDLILTSFDRKFFLV